MALGWVWWRAWFPFGAVGATAVGVAGVALGGIDRHFARQAWHFATSNSALRGRRGTYGTGLALVARSRLAPWAPLLLAWQAWHLAALTVFAWQAWHLWHWTGSGGALGSRLAPWAPWLFAWQAWHFAALTVTLRGRCGTSRHRPPLCVAGVALLGTGMAGGALRFPFGAVGAAAVGVAGRSTWRH